MPKLSIIVAAYDMQREVPRTARSLLPPMQREVESIDYEVIVVDNGSPTALTVGEGATGLLQDVISVRITADEAQTSPVHCINAAVAKWATGDWLLIWIDGARLASPYLVRRTLDVLERHPDAFTFVASRHLGFRRQMESTREGYDQRIEDELLRTVPWEDDLDLLFPISVWAGAHDRRNPVLQNESNGFGIARSIWDALGGYDEGFRAPGGGLCNLELFERAVQRPPSLGSLNVLLYGESTFHQVHGGAATSRDGYFQQSQEEYARVTGRSYRRPSYSFFADLGEAYGRMEAVGRYLIEERDRG